MTNHAAPLEDPHARLELTLIDEFLGRSGHTRESMARMEATDRTALLTAASEYASLRLADIESKAHYVDELHRPV